MPRRKKNHQLMVDASNVVIGTDLLLATLYEKYIHFEYKIY